MKLNVFMMSVVIGLVPNSVFATTPGNSVAGKQVYLHQCSGCHSNLAGVDRFGPTLAGVYGRMSGTAPRHRYSAAMKSAHIVWTSKTLNLFLQNPRGYVHGTSMPYRGLASASARANVIAYLRSISPKGIVRPNR